MQSVTSACYRVANENGAHRRSFFAAFATFGVAVLHRRRVLHDAIAVSQRLDGFVHGFRGVGRAFHRRAGNQLAGDEFERIYLCALYQVLGSLDFPSGILVLRDQRGCKSRGQY